MRGRILVGLSLAGMIAVAAWGRGVDEIDKKETVSLTVESIPKGKLRVTQTIRGRKPLVLEIEARDDRFDMKYGDDTTISADQFRIEFNDGQADRITARGKVRMTPRHEQIDADMIDAKIMPRTTTPDPRSKQR